MHGHFKTRGVAVSWEEGKRRGREQGWRWESGTWDVHCDRLLPKDLKQTQQNIKLLLSCYVLCIMLMLFTLCVLEILAKKQNSLIKNVHVKMKNKNSDH